MRTKTLFLFGTLQMALVGCGSTVSGGGTTGTGGAGGASAAMVSTTVSASSGVTGPATGSGGAATQSAVLSGTDTLSLHLASFPLTCADPGEKPPFDRCGWFTVEITFAAALLAPGPVNTTILSITVFYQEAGEGDPGGECYGAAAVTGGGGGATLEKMTFVSIDSQTVVVDISGPFSSPDHTIDGVYTAARCP